MKTKTRIYFVSAIIAFLSMLAVLLHFLCGDWQLGEVVAAGTRCIIKMLACLLIEASLAILAMRAENGF